MLRNLFSRLKNARRLDPMLLGHLRDGPNMRRSRSQSYRPFITLLEDRTVLSFLSPVSYDVGSTPRFVAVGDFNGDGARDLAVANWGTGTASILLGNGDGTFSAAGSYDYGGGGFGGLAV